MVLLLQRGSLSAAQLEVSLILKLNCVYNLFLKLCSQNLQSLICQNLEKNANSCNTTLQNLQVLLTFSCDFLINHIS